MRPKMVLIGGGVGSSTFTKALKDLPVELTTIVSSFDDGGSTGAIRRDYGGIALGDFRQCLLANLDIQEDILNTLNYRFGNGNLFGVNIGNLLIKAFLNQYRTERAGVNRLHKLLGLKRRVMPVSYTFSRLQAKLSNGKVLQDQHQIATYLNFAKAGIKSIGLKPAAKLNPDVRKAILSADILVFAPGHFFTSVLPHLYVEGFASAWKQSKAKKLWFVNLLAHKGQDGFYDISDYLKWFEKSLGRKTFDTAIINKKVSSKTLRLVEDRFAPLRITPKGLEYLRAAGTRVEVADLVSSNIRRQQANDVVMRAPLRHDARKIRKFFSKLLNV